jgi:hypothetical protein
VMLEGIHGCCELRHFWQQVHDLLAIARSEHVLQVCSSPCLG